MTRGNPQGGRRRRALGIGIVAFGVAVASSGPGAWVVGAAADGDPIRIGLITSLSGPLTELGTPYGDSAQLAVGQINAAGGVEVDGETHELVLEVRDDRSDPQVAVAAATELVEDEELNVLVAPLISSIAPGVVEYAAPRGVLVLSGATVEPFLLDGGADGDYATLFKSQVSVEDRGSMLMNGLLQLMPDIERGATLVPAIAPGQQMAAGTQRAGEKYGVEVAVMEEYAAGTTELSTPLTRIRDGDADFLLMCCTSADIASVVRQAVQLDAVGAFVAGTYPMAIPMQDAIGEPIDRPSVHLGLPAFHEQLPDGTVFTFGDAMAEYAAIYEETFDRPPPAAASNGLFIYDYVFMLTQAMEAAGTTDDATAIAEALEQVTYQGVIGELAFDENHLAVHGIQACRVDAGEITECVEVPYESIEDPIE